MGGQYLYCYTLLIISGIIGIGMGDNFWFQSVKLIGPRITILFELLTPLISFLLTSILLGEVQTFLTWVGMFITVFGIYLVILSEENEENLSRSQSRRGSVYGKKDLLLTDQTDHEQEGFLSDIEEEKVDSLTNFLRVSWRCRYAFLFVSLQALGAVISHVALISSDIGIISSAWIRLISSGIYVFLTLYS